MADIESNAYIVSSFFKVSGEYKVLKNEEYVITSVDKKSKSIKYNKEEDGRFNLNLDMGGYPDTSGSHELIPDVILNEIKGVETKQDVIDAFGSDDYYIFRDYYSDYYEMRFSFPVLVKPVKSEPGYKKLNFLVPATSEVKFYHDANDEITNIQIKVNIGGGTAHLVSAIGGYIIYDQERSFDSLEELRTTLGAFVPIDDVSCMNTNAGMIITDDNCTTYEPYYFVSSSYSLVPYFVAEKGTVEFKIENTVNGQIKYNASKDKNLEYRINVKNTGNAASGDNVITTYIPKELTIKEDGISDNGVYNKDKHSITWEVDYLDTGETVEFSYTAVAPETSDGKELLGHSTIESGQVAGVTLSGNTIVTLDRIVEIIDNPDTGMMVYIANTNIGLPISVLIMFAISLFVVIVFLIKRMKQERRVK